MLWHCTIVSRLVFDQAYGRDLMEAQDWCRKYMRSGNVKDLTQAWDLYYHVFRRIAKQLPQVSQTMAALLVLYQYKWDPGVNQHFQMLSLSVADGINAQARLDKKAKRFCETKCNSTVTGCKINKQNAMKKQGFCNYSNYIPSFDLLLGWSFFQPMSLTHP